MNLNTKISLAGIVATALLLASPALAASKLDWHSHVNRHQCDAVGKAVVDVDEGVKNDADSGIAGNYWAFDTFSREILVFKTTTPGVYCGVVKYRGQFQAVAGQTSPGATGTLDGTEHGKFDGGYQSTITGTLLTTPTWPKKGDVGTVDYQCDILGNCPGYVNWVDQYFNAGATNDLNWWGWIYHGKKDGVWINSIDGNSGDVL